MVEETISLLGHHLTNLRYYYQNRLSANKELFYFNMKRAYSDYSEQRQEEIFSIFDKIIDNKGLKIKLIAGTPDIICKTCNNRNDYCFKHPHVDKLYIEDFGMKEGVAYTSTYILDKITEDPFYVGLFFDKNWNLIK